MFLVITLSIYLLMQFAAGEFEMRSIVSLDGRVALIVLNLRDNKEVLRMKARTEISESQLKKNFSRQQTLNRQSRLIEDNNMFKSTDII